jgi:Protein of unknown function (DUF3667)
LSQVDVIQPAACPNCGGDVTGAYCAGCGQKQSSVDVTVGAFVSETAQELTSWDGKIPSTLRALFFQPGVLTVDFLAGRRARWLSPLRLYLLCGVAFFVCQSLVDAFTYRGNGRLSALVTRNPDGTTTLAPEARAAIEGGLPARIFGVDRMERAAARAAEFDREAGFIVPKSMFVLLPLFALFTRLAWGSRLPRFPAHLYFALHLHAAWFGALALSTVVTAFAGSATLETIIGTAVTAYALGYGIVATRRLFGEPWQRTIVKSAAVAVVYAICLFAMSLALVAYVLERLD